MIQVPPNNMFSFIITRKCNTYCVLVYIFYLGVPKQNSQPAYHQPCIKDLTRYQIVHRESHDLGYSLEMFPDEAAAIMAHIICQDFGNIQPVRDNRVQAGLKRLKASIFVEEPGSLAPVVFYNAEKNGVCRISVGVS